LTAGRRRSVADFNLCIVHMRQYLPKIAHVEPFPAAWAFHEMIGLGWARYRIVKRAFVSSRDQPLARRCDGFQSGGMALVPIKRLRTARLRIVPSGSLGYRY